MNGLKLVRTVSSDGIDIIAIKPVGSVTRDLPGNWVI